MSIPTSNSNTKTDTDSSDLKNYYKDSYAIIIGINQYKEETPLANAGNDAKKVMEVLEKKYGFCTIKCLFDQEATGDQLREIFYDILQDEQRIGPRDRVLIYYSGHGKLRTRVIVGNEMKEGYIVPYDSKREKYSSNIPMETIIDGCQKCPAKHVLLILDCCYSGFAATRAVEPPIQHAATDEYIKDISSRRAIQVLAAGQEDQPVNDSGVRPGYSAFTGALLDILEPEIDPDDNGILTASEIGFNLERRVALQEQTGSYQRPVYNKIAGSQGGDFIFKIFRKVTPPKVEDKVIQTEVNGRISISLTPNPEDMLDISVIQHPRHGTLTPSVTPTTVVYTPNVGFAGTDSFIYKASDRKGVSSNIATVTIRVNVAPPHPQPSPKPPINVIILMAIIVAVVVIGSVFIYHYYYPTPNYYPTPKPKIIENNQNPLLNTSSLIASSQIVSTPMNKPIDVIFRINDSQNPNAILTATIVRNPLHGNLSTINQNCGNVTYTPDPSYVGTDKFGFKVNDGKISSNNATITVLVGQPKAVDQGVTTVKSPPVCQS